MGSTIVSSHIGSVDQKILWEALWVRVRIETLLVIWRRLDDVPLDDVRPWSYGVAKRCLANQRRGNMRRLRLVSRVSTTAATNAQREEPSVDDSDHPELSIAVAELDESDRELVRLWAWEQLQPREIALVLDTTANAVSLRLSRAKKKLAMSIERQNRERAGHVVFGHRKEIGS